MHVVGGTDDGWFADFKLQMLREFGHFDPKVVKILR